MRMNRLHQRIASQPGHAAASMGAYHPVADQPMTMPVVRVTFLPGGASFEEMTPVYGAGYEHAPLPGAPAARFDQQLAQAGRP